MFDGLRGLRFIPGAGILASGSMDHIVSLWNLNEQQPNDILGKTLATGNANGLIKLMSPLRRQRSQSGSARVRRSVADPD